MSEKNKVRVGIIGASGYSGEELVRLMLAHPNVDLTVVTSRQYSGKTIAEIFPRFGQYSRANELHFRDPIAEMIARDAEVVFLALPHGVAAEFAKPLLELGCRVIDLSADFRLNDAETYKKFYTHEHPAPELLTSSVYGLPEIHGEAIKDAQLIASPGCYPTSILLPTIPLLRAGLIKPSGIIADCLSGVSGAGRKVELGYLYVECNESVRPYGVPKHRHLSEIEQELSLAAGEQVTIQFTPHLIPVNRGILSTLYLAPAEKFDSKEDATALNDKIAAVYAKAYDSAPFVRLLKGPALPDTKNVTGTNVVEIAWRIDPRTDRLIVMSAEDNLIKGASGQAVQSMNLVYGFEATAGLI